ncbi:MAG: hypothetical protein GY953_01385 [bacterium]|nr:hypothetical protein [bacterium]
MIPASEAAHLVVLVPDQLGLLIHPGRIGENGLTNRRNLEVAPLGLSGGWLETPETHWLRATRATRAGTLCQANLHALAAGQPAGRKT